MLQAIRHLLTRPGCFRPERELPDGGRTHLTEAPLDKAHTPTPSSGRSGRSAWDARTACSPDPTAEPATGRSWRAWWRPRVESATGAVAVEPEELLLAGGFRPLPVPQLGPWLRLQSPLVKPDVRLARIRLSPASSSLRARQVATVEWQGKEAEHPVQMLVRVSAVPRASPAPPSHQPSSDPSLDVPAHQAVGPEHPPLVEVRRPAPGQAGVDRPPPPRAGGVAPPRGGLVGSVLPGAGPAPRDWCCAIATWSLRGSVAAGDGPPSGTGVCRYRAPRPCRRTGRPCSRGSRSFPSAIGSAGSWLRSPSAPAVSSAAASSPGPPARFPAGSR